MSHTKQQLNMLIVYISGCSRVVTTSDWSPLLPPVRFLVLNPRTVSLSRGGRSGDFAKQVPSSGEYYFVFGNYDKNHVAAIIISIDQQTQSTITNMLTVYSTRQTTVTTVSTTSIPTATNTQSWIDYGLLLASGTIVVVVIVAALFIMRRKSVPPTLIQHPAVTPSPALASPTKFCRHCGAKIPRDSKHCEECGARLVGLQE